jgi:prolyl-tRNA editing enzyme YbaK/EbsC (Cys-tRNA(Pro) deacylase)
MAWKTIENMHPNGVKVRDALRAAGVDTDIVETLEGSPTAATAAAQLDIEVGQVCNSLLFNADGGPLLILASGGHKVDVNRVAAELGFDSVHRPDADFVREFTGQPIGGVAPLGHPTPVRTVIDTHLANWDTVWAAGGHPHYVFPTSFDELVRITGGQPLDVGVKD